MSTAPSCARGPHSKCTGGAELLLETMNYGLSSAVVSHSWPRAMRPGAHYTGVQYRDIVLFTCIIMIVSDRLWQRHFDTTHIVRARIGGARRWRYRAIVPRTRGATILQYAKSGIPNAQYSEASRAFRGIRSLRMRVRYHSQTTRLGLVGTIQTMKQPSWSCEMQQLGRRQQN